MPIYEYACSVCGHRADILHGVNDPGPHYCPECGAEGTMRKAFAVPAVHFKGSGWAKKERRSSAASKSGPTKDAAATSGESGESGESGSASSDPPAAAPATSAGDAVTD